MIGLKLARFYPVLDSAVWARTGMPLTDVCEAILEGGAGMLQLRHKAHFSRQMLGEARTMARMCASAEAWFVINDRADIAALLDCALHLGQDDLRPSEARPILPADCAIGFSTHNEAQLLEAEREPADYLALGPIFRTGSKDNPDPVVGLDELKRLRGATRRPLVAIGGMTRESAPAAIEAGADSVAVIADLLPPEHTKPALRKRTEEWVQLLKDVKTSLTKGWWDR